jgi:transcriptional regulator with XRE-family HTH domain
MMKSPNEKLRRARELKGWSQQKVASLIETTKESVCVWESGKHRPGKYYQEKLCALFEKNAEELGFIDTQSTTKQATEPNMMASSLPSPQQSDNILITSTPFAQAISQGIMAAIYELEEQDLNKLRRKILQASGAIFVVLGPFDQQHYAKDDVLLNDNHMMLLQNEMNARWHVYQTGGALLLHIMVLMYG